MATKPLDFLNRLPSVSELLEKQPVRALTERLNQSVVASGVRTFLDELRTDLRRRAAEVPTIRELAERAAQYVVAQQRSAHRSIINATGQIVGGPWVGVPLSDAALERAVAASRDFALAPKAGADDLPALATEISDLVRRTTGAEAAIAVHSYVGGLWLVLAALAAGREVLVSRAEVGEIDAAGTLPNLASAAGAVLRDVGTANRTSAADYAIAASPRASVLLRLDLDSYRIVGETSSASFAELVTVARDCELVLVSAVGVAPFVGSAELGSWPRQSVREVVEAGADVVVVRGEGLLGGPTCGVLLGKQEIIARIAEHPLCAAWQIDPLRASALVATLQRYVESGNFQQSVPVWQLLSAPVENLRNRAERIAPQVVQAQGVAAAEPVETHSRLCAAFGGQGWPSYGIALSPLDGDVESLDKRLRRASAPVYGRIENGRLILDLRTVFPRQDRLLVEAVNGRPLEDGMVSPAAPTGA